MGMVKELEEVQLFSKTCSDTSVLRFNRQELPLQDIMQILKV